MLRLRACVEGHEGHTYNTVDLLCFALPFYLVAYQYVVDTYTHYTDLYCRIKVPCANALGNYIY